MSKKLLILAGIMLIAVPAFSAVQNVKVSGDITTYAVWQDELDLNDDEDYSSEADDHGFLATITRLRVDADLTDNVSATVRLINERVWDQESTASTDVDLDLAYLTLKEMFYSPLTVIIGRQELRYGSALIVGDPDTNASAAGSDSSFESKCPFLSKRKAFDAIRAILDYDPWTIDLVYAKIDEVDEASNYEDEDLWGVNVAYKFAEYDAEAEGYFFFKDDDAQDIWVLGARGSMVPVDGLTVGGELAYQGGDYTTAAGSSRDQDAWAATIYGQYTWATEYEPTVKLCYDYRSGQDNSKSTGDYEAWLPLYEDQTKGLIADWLFGGVNEGVASNAHIINLGGSFKPLEDLTVALDWYHYILDEDLNSSSISGKTTCSMTEDDDFGDEIDLAITYDYTEDVQFGLQAGWFLPGDAFADSNDDDAMEVIGSVSVSF
jgi:hypothetical protein